jgi:protein-tyrosine-phosphatase
MTNQRLANPLPTGYEYLGQWYATFIDNFPHFARNVFVMMPFTTSITNEIYEAVARAAKHHGLVPLRADMKQFAPVVWWNVLTYMIGSSYGIVIYEPKDCIPFNPNVSIEAGFMLGVDRQVLLLANQKLTSMPIDFSGRVFRTFSDTNISQSVFQAVSDWITRDLSYFAYGDKKLIVFASLGGTCRCVMAKAILQDRLEKSKIVVAVDAAAVADPYNAKISPSAVRVLEEVNCSEWIKDHRPRKLSAYLQDRANLVVVLTDSALRASDRSGKVVTDVGLFGRQIANPYPDNEDNESLEKYREARRAIERGIDDNFEKLLNLANARPQI